MQWKCAMLIFNYEHTLHTAHQHFICTVAFPFGENLRIECVSLCVVLRQLAACSFHEERWDVLPWRLMVKTAPFLNVCGVFGKKALGSDPCHGPALSCSEAGQGQQKGIMCVWNSLSFCLRVYYPQWRWCCSWCRCLWRLWYLLQKHTLLCSLQRYSHPCISNHVLLAIVRTKHSKTIQITCITTDIL